MKNKKNPKRKKISIKAKTSSHRKITSGKKSVKQQSTVRRRKAPRKSSANVFSKENFQELVPQEIYQPKFYSSYEPVEHSPTFDELPDGFHEDKIVAQVRDPWWIHTYWEVRSQTVEDIRNRYKNNFNGAKAILRVYDVSFINFDGSNAHRYFDIEIALEARNWYIDVGEPGRSWCIDLGFRLADGTFIMIARSNTVTTPLDGPSWETDEEWMIPDDKFARLYGIGFGISSPTRKGLMERFRVPIGSPGLFSITSPIRKKKEMKARKFWFELDTELIVRGATEPNAKVTVRGQEVKLNSDGTFTLRFPLPDGQQIVPVEALSFDGIDHRSVTPVVSRETR